MKTAQFYSGTSGLVLPVPQAQYPVEFQGASRLTYYSSLFSSLEINSSFYKNPKPATVAKWAESVRDKFQFTFKISKAITHVKGLQFKEEDVKTFMLIADGIGDKKGCLLAQFPPGLKSDRIDQLRLLLETIKTFNNDWKLAMEFRSATWYTEELYNLLSSYNVAMVMHDIPASVTPSNILTADLSYFRFHGPGGSYRGSYSDEFLSDYAKRISKIIKDGKEVYAYFNNTMGDAVKNLQTLNSYIEAFWE